MLARRALLAGGLAWPLGARAGQEDRLTLLVGAPAGSATDEGARAFIPFLERHWPPTVVTVLARPGEAGLAAWQALAGSDPASRELAWVVTPSLSARTVDHASACAGLIQRLRLLGAVQQEPVCFVSRAGGPLASVRDILRRAAGNVLATPPAGSPPYLAALRLGKLAGTELTILPFPSAAAAAEAARSGNVAAAALALGDAIEGLRAGRLAGLGIAAPGRHEAFPDLAPLRESGLDLSAAIWRGIAVPAGADAAWADGLATALRAVAGDGGFRDQGLASGFVATWLDGKAWAALAAAEHEELAALWREAPWPAASA